MLVGRLMNDGLWIKFVLRAVKIIWKIDALEIIGGFALFSIIFFSSTLPADGTRAHEGFDFQ